MFSFWLISGDPFIKFRQGFGTLMMTLFGIALVITLVIVGYNIMSGEREAAKGFIRWVLVALVGFIIFTLLVNL